MTLDTNRPMFYRVTIDGTGFTSAAPANGFIDNTIVEKYMSRWTLTGSTPVVLMLNGDTIHINEQPVTFTTAGGLDIAGVISTINALIELHHAVASNDGSDDLVLNDEDGFDGNPITVTGSVAVLTRLGYVAPVKSAIPGAAPSTLANAEAKARGNCRFRYLIEQIERDCTPMYIGAIVKTGGTVNAQPTQIDFTIGLATGDVIYTYDETNNNAIIEGIPAIQRMVARSLMVDKFQLFSVYDPSTYAGHTGNIVKGARIENIHVGALTTDIAVATAAVVVVAKMHIR